MNRDITKKIDEYNKYRKTSKRGKFTVSDIEQIKQLHNNNGKIEIISMIGSALKVGFVIGYHAANNDRN